MAKTTPIHWTDSAVNPVMGCPGCELWNKERRSCYAAILHNRRTTSPGFSPDFSHPKLFPGRTTAAAGWSDLTGTDRADKPWLNGLPRFIFISDMGDALAECGAIDFNNMPVPAGAVPFEFLKAEIVDVVLSPNGLRHVWLWPTKRPRRMAQFSSWLNTVHHMNWPANLWAGTTVTGNVAMVRLDPLLQVGNESTVRFLSVEPLLEEISLAGRLNGIHWVIVGGESSQESSPGRQFDCQWGRSLRAECAAARVPFFLKQLGANATDNGKTLQLADGHGDDWNEWPADLRIRQMPRVASRQHQSK